MVSVKRILVVMVVAWTGRVSVADAQSVAGRFGEQGQLALSAERLFGFVSSTTSVEQMGVEADVTTTTFGIGWRQVSSPFAVPRLALDGFVSNGFSIGGAAGFSTTSLSAGGDSMGASVDVDLGSAWVLLLHPRVGYAYMFSRSAGIWPRAGMSFVFGNAGPDEGASMDLDGDGVPDITTDGDTSFNAIAISLDLPLVLTPAEHVGFLIGPAVDIGVSGSTESDTVDAGGVTTSTNQDFTMLDIGIHAGIFGWW